MKTLTEVVSAAKAEREAKAVALLNKGAKFADAALATGLSRRSIGRLAYKLGIQPRRGRPRKSKAVTQSPAARTAT
jgi:hypothetical protein